MKTLSNAIEAPPLAVEPLGQPTGSTIARDRPSVAGNGNNKTHPAEISRTGNAPAAGPHGIEHPVEVSRTVIGTTATMAR